MLVVALKRAVFAGSWSRTALWEIPTPSSGEISYSNTAQWSEVVTPYTKNTYDTGTIARPR
jgi:hypothetical protein